MESLEKQIADLSLTIRKAEIHKFNEAFTPTAFINHYMLDKLPASVWKRKEWTWLDPAAGIGNFAMEIYKRLMVGLRTAIPSDTARARHIWEHMIYMVELNARNAAVIRKHLQTRLGFRIHLSQSDFLRGDPPAWSREFGLTQFDVVLGNPPYNQERSKVVASGDAPLYSRFVDRAAQHCRHHCLFVIPSRWMMGGQAELASFRKRMFESTHIQEIEHFPNAAAVWPQLHIRGGVQVLWMDMTKRQDSITMNGVHGIHLRDFVQATVDVAASASENENTDQTEDEKGTRKGKGEEGKEGKETRTYMPFLPINHPELMHSSTFRSLCRKLALYKASGKETMDQRYASIAHYRIQTNAPYLKTESQLPSSSSQRGDYVKCFVSQAMGSTRWVHKSHLPKTVLYNYWKVMFPYGSGVGFDGFFTGIPRVGGPGVVHSKTYLHFRLDDQTSAQAFVSFLQKSDLANFLVSLRKIDQHISEKTVEYIPMPSTAILHSGNTTEWTAAKEHKYQTDLIGLTAAESRLVSTHARLVFSRPYKSHTLSLLSTSPSSPSSSPSPSVVQGPSQTVRRPRRGRRRQHQGQTRKKR